MRDESQNKDEAAIERTLAALARTTPPEGMEARINQRLRYAAAHASAGASVTNSAKTWWFGALIGAAVASLLFSIAILSLRGRPAHSIPNNLASSAKDTRIVAVSRPAEPRMSVPCPDPAVRRQPRHVNAQAVLRAAAEPEPPAPHSVSPLTPQERELVRLTRVAAPKDLSTMTLEARATAEAQQSAAFQKFFTPPPPPPHDEGVNE